MMVDDLISTWMPSEATIEELRTHNCFPHVRLCQDERRVSDIELRIQHGKGSKGWRAIVRFLGTTRPPDETTKIDELWKQLLASGLRLNPMVNPPAVVEEPPPEPPEFPG
jgi:hypothetical protein